MRELQREAEEICAEYIETPQEMESTADDEVHFECAQVCHICRIILVTVMTAYVTIVIILVLTVELPTAAVTSRLEATCSDAHSQRLRRPPYRQGTEKRIWQS